MRTRHPTIVEKLITLVVAVVPATALQAWTLLGLFAAFGALIDGELAALIIGPWALGGVFGALALWGVLFGSRAAWVAFGLVAGLLAILPMSVSALAVLPRVSDASELLYVAWAIALPLSAIYWLFRIDWSEPDDDPLLLEYRPEDGHSDRS